MIKQLIALGAHKRCQLAALFTLYDTYHRRLDRQSLSIRLWPSNDIGRRYLLDMRRAHMAADLLNLGEQCQPFVVCVVKSKQSVINSYCGITTGVIVDNQLGLIVTNYSAIAGSDIVTIIFNNPRLRYLDVFVGHNSQQLAKETTGRVVYTEPYRNLALIQLPPVNPGRLVCANFTITTSEPGDPIVAIGRQIKQYFINDGLIVQPTVVSVPYELATRDVPVICREYCMHTGFISNAHYGGPVINMNGQVIGIILHHMGGFSYYILTIKAEAIIDFINKGKTYLAHNEPQMVIGRRNNYERGTNKTLGLILTGNRIVDIALTSLEIKNQLKVTDSIEYYNNQPFNTPDQLAQYVQQMADNEFIELTINREGYDMQFSVNVIPVTVRQINIKSIGCQTSVKLLLNQWTQTDDKLRNTNEVNNEEIEDIDCKISCQSMDETIEERVDENNDNNSCNRNEMKS
ncbi:uncharacterized serine protease syc0938_d-like [Oppia nitens]|uniref:uncharacterized serine protease syc0938_d-like n=1 Tax=Oppia nitens TaxID=1686743 RepID=UPI0023DA7CEA|nr:uncharacterized serine protease syc0938_d-like [Oppia nitens]